MFGHLFCNRIKVILKQRSMIFWTLVFPLALATFFNLAFSNLTNSEKFKVPNIAVIDNQNYQSNVGFKTMIEAVSKKDDNQLFNVDYVKNEKDAKAKLEDNKIAGYYKLTDKIDIVIKNNGIDQTIMKLTVDKFNQINNITDRISKNNYDALKNGVLNELSKDANYIEATGTRNTDATVIYFYTLIGMVCMYAGFFGISAVNESEANLSTRGARINVSPTHKFKSLIALMLAGWLIQFVELLILLAYLFFVLHVDFGNQIIQILLLMMVGSFAGVNLGAFFGSLTKKSEDTKISIFVTFTLVLSFLAGMMVLEMRLIIANNFPLLGYINPVSTITDALYSLYYYGDNSRYLFNIMNLIIFSVVMIISSYYLLRRKKYDSI